MKSETQSINENQADSMWRRLRRSPQFLQLILVAGLVLLFPLITFVSQQVVKLRSRAGAAASLLLLPGSANLSQGQSQTFSLMLNADTNLMSFVHVELTFDRTKLQLADVTTPIVTIPQFARKVQVTDKTTANSTGTITLALGLDPGAPAPTGTFELAKLPFIIVSASDNDTTTITVADANVLLVDTQANPVSLTIPTQPAHLTLNELVVASPALQPSPVASATPVPSALDTTTPAVTIISPIGGSTVARNSVVTITATASDNVGIAKVEFRVGDKLLCTDTTASYTCSWNVTGKPRASYTLEARAHDGAGNTGTHQITVTSAN